MKRLGSILLLIGLVLALAAAPVSAQTLYAAPVQEDLTSAIAIAVAVSFLIALVVVLILRSGMKNVHIKREAGQYTVGALKLTRKQDRFTHKTTSRVKVASSSSKPG